MSTRTLLQLTNQVLKRLREPEVATTVDTPQSVIIAEYIKEELEDAASRHNWSSLEQEIQSGGPWAAGDFVTQPLVNTNAGTLLMRDGHTINLGSGSQWTSIQPVSRGRMSQLRERDRMQPNTQAVRGVPRYFAVTMKDEGLVADVWPVPNQQWTVRIRVRNTPELTSDTSIIPIPWRVVEAMALARTLRERGEPTEVLDKAERTAKDTLAQYISIDSQHSEGDLTWTPT